MSETLYAAMQAYAANTAAGVDPIVYDAHAYPYFFNDTDGDGEPNDGFLPGHCLCCVPHTTTSILRRSWCVCAQQPVRHANFV